MPSDFADCFIFVVPLLSRGLLCALPGSPGQFAVESARPAPPLPLPTEVGAPLLGLPVLKCLFATGYETCAPKIQRQSLYAHAMR